MKAKFLFLVLTLSGAGSLVLAAARELPAQYHAINIVLLELDNSPEGLAAKRCEMNHWETWEKSAPILLEQLERDMNRPRAIVGGDPSAASLFSLCVAARGLDDSQSLVPAGLKLDDLSKQTQRANFIVAWDRSRSLVLLGFSDGDTQPAKGVLNVLARMCSEAHHLSLLQSDSLPRLAPPCVLTVPPAGLDPLSAPLEFDALVTDQWRQHLFHSLATAEESSEFVAWMKSGMPAMPPGAEMNIEVLQKNVDRFADATKLLYKVANIEMPYEMKVPLSFAGAAIGDTRAAGEGKLNPLTSQSLERLGKFGISELPKVLSTLETAGKLPAGYTATLTPILAGLPDITAASFSQIGRQSTVPTVAEVTKYLDGMNKACWATVGALVASPGGPAASARGASIASTSAGLAGDIARGWSYGLFEQAALDPVKKQMVSDFRTQLDAAVGHGVEAKSFTDMFSQKEISRLGFDPKTVADLDNSARWANSLRSAPSQSKPPLDLDVKLKDPIPIYTDTLTKYKPRDYSTLFPPGGPGGGGGGIARGPDGGGGGGSLALNRPESPGGLGALSSSDRFRLSQLPPAPLRSDYDSFASRFSAPDLQLKSVMFTPKPAGILFYPELEVVADATGLTASIADKAVAALQDKTAVETVIEGERRIVVAAPGSEDFFKVQAGRYHMNQTDIAGAQRARTLLTLRRFYDSGETNVSCLGRGWSFLPYALRIDQSTVQSKNGQQFAPKVTLIDRDRVVEVAYEADSTQGAATGKPAASGPVYRPVSSPLEPVLSLRTNAGYLVTFAHGLQLAFNAAGRLESQGHSESNRVTYVFKGDNLSEVVSAQQSILLNYEASGRLSGATGPDAESVLYTVDASGLRSVKASGKAEAAFAYGPDGRISTFETVKGTERTVVTANSYDTQGRLLTQRTLRGEWAYKYDDAIGCACVTDPSGKQTTYFYDGNSRLLASGSSPKNMTLFNYDLLGRVIQVADAEWVNNSSPGHAPRFKITKVVSQFSSDPNSPEKKG